MNPQPLSSLGPLGRAAAFVLIGLAVFVAVPAGYRFGRMILDWMGLP
jgi:hypothetical protein